MHVSTGILKEGDQLNSKEKKEKNYENKNKFELSTKKTEDNTYENMTKEIKEKLNNKPKENKDNKENDEDFDDTINMIAKNDLKEDEEKKEQNNIENENNENINDKREEIYNSLKSDPQNYSKINQYNNTQTILGHSEKVTLK